MVEKDFMADGNHSKGPQVLAESKSCRNSAHTSCKYLQGTSGDAIALQSTDSQLGVWFTLVILKRRACSG